MDDQDWIERQTQRRMNPMTLRRLAQRGDNLSREREIVNVFNAPSRRHLSSLCVALQTRGFRIADAGTPMEHEGRSYWRIEATLQLVPELESVNAMTDQCVEMASRFQIEYDGWYSEVVGPE